MSRPSESVPIQCVIVVFVPSSRRTVSSVPGVLFRYTGLICAGSIDVSSGAASPMSRISARIDAPMAIVGFFHSRRDEPGARRRRRTGGRFETDGVGRGAQYRIRGSRTVYSRSTTRLTSTYTNENSRITAWIVG